MDIIFSVTFEQKDKAHTTTIHCSSMREVLQNIELYKPEYKCTHVEVIWDITDLIKDKNKE